MQLHQWNYRLKTKIIFCNFNETTAISKKESKEKIQVINL